MRIFPWQKKKEFFTQEEQHQIVHAIKEAEKRTSGEIRLYVESRCKFADAIDRAQEIFGGLKMYETELHNATLLYIAIKDKQTAVFGDQEIHEKVGEDYWRSVIKKMLTHFRDEKLVVGICSAIHDLGEALHANFPYNEDTDKNELPDEIVFGK